MPTIALPSDFPSQHFDALMGIGEVLEAGYREKTGGLQNPIWSHFIAAMLGCSYRWRALAEADEAFTETIRLGAATIEERYTEESALFGFFTNGYSAFELFYFTQYALAAQLRPAQFTMLPDCASSVTPKQVVHAFKYEYPGELLTAQLECALNGPVCQEVKGLRNVLSHRGAPPRRFAYGPATLPGGQFVAASPEWQGRPLDANLTPTIRNGLARELNRLFEVARAFACQQIGKIIG